MLFKLKELQKNIGTLRVAVIGDYCLDQYWYMDTTYDKKMDYNEDVSFGLSQIEYFPGGAGNVAKNFIKMGVKVKCVGIIGNDGVGFELRKALRNLNADIDNLLPIEGRETHSCIRPFRIQQNEKNALNEIITHKFVKTDALIERKVSDILDRIINEVDALVLVEQFDNNNYGIFTDAVRQHLQKLVSKYPEKLFLVDSRKYVNKYPGMYLKCNREEFSKTVGGLTEINDEIWGTLLDKHFGTFRSLFVTCAEEGVKVFASNRKFYQVRPLAVEHDINSCGAGDASTVGIVIGLFSRYSPEKSALLGNITASIAIKDKNSTGYATYESLCAVLNNYEMIG